MAEIEPRIESQMDIKFECDQIEPNKTALAPLCAKDGEVNMKTKALIIVTTISKITTTSSKKRNYEDYYL